MTEIIVALVGAIASVFVAWIQSRRVPPSPSGHAGPEVRPPRSTFLLTLLAGFCITGFVVYVLLVRARQIETVAREVARQGAVPVGGVVAFWGEQPVPVGFELCDGGVVSDPDSPIAGMRKPDLTNRFARGLPSNVQDATVLEPGGNDSVDLSHTHDEGGLRALMGPHDLKTPGGDTFWSFVPKPPKHPKPGPLQVPEGLELSENEYRPGQVTPRGGRPVVGIAVAGSTGRAHATNPPKMPKAGGPAPSPPVGALQDMSYVPIVPSYCSVFYIIRVR